jgi:hypothetical protein
MIASQIRPEINHEEHEGSKGIRVQSGDRGVAGA